MKGNVARHGRVLAQLLLGFSLLLALPSVGLAKANLSAFRIVQQEHVMLHFDMDKAVEGATVFTLQAPDRLVIDLPETSLATDLPAETFMDGVVSSVRYGEHDGAKLRVVLDLRRAIAPEFRFVPRQGGQRLVIDLGVQGNPELASSSFRTTEVDPSVRDVIVAIDAGHGGKDPGALGQRKTREKDITLAVAQRLYQRLAARPGIRPFLTRESDVTLPLGKRMELARDARADVFISIHADAFTRLSAKGSSVFALSLDGASSTAAAWLARSENESAALYGDVTLDGLDSSLQETLLNLAQNTTLESSLDLGAEVLAGLKQIGPVHKAEVEQAAFAVLKAPDIPSILVETAFISNLEEEKKLNSGRFQEQLAAAIEAGIVRYLARRAPEGTMLYAERRAGG